MIGDGTYGDGDVMLDDMLHHSRPFKQSITLGLSQGHHRVIRGLSEGYQRVIITLYAPLTRLFAQNITLGLLSQGHQGYHKRVIRAIRRLSEGYQRAIIKTISEG